MYLPVEILEKIRKEREKEISSRIPVQPELPNSQEVPEIPQELPKLPQEPVVIDLA